MSYRGVGHAIFSLHLVVGHSVLLQMEGVGHVFLTTTFRNAPAHSPVLFDQSLNINSLRGEKRK